ncbi:MAG: 4-hydroxy-3-methylbut-2-enyl diphosphate reductase [Erysipelotrichaceae bacterium]
MEIIKVVPRGFCKGVVGAIELAKRTRREYPHEKITILGMLVHNKFVVEALYNLNIETVEEKGVSRLDLLDRIDSGIVIFTAHGIDEKAFSKALSKGLKVVDATCPDVTKTQTLIKAYLQNGYSVIYIGKKGHPESEAAVALGEQVHLVETQEELQALQLQGPLFLTNQTTMSMEDVASLIETARNRFAQLEVCEEICDATRMRQKAIADLQNVDLLYVVGDPHSNNSTRLAHIGLQHGVKRSLLIESVQDIDLRDLEGCERVAISAGASTPTYLTKQVIDFLEHYEQNQQKPAIDMQQIL